MGQSSCIQLFSTKEQVISVNGKVGFNQISIQADAAISYDTDSHEIMIRKKGQFQVNWWLSPQTGRQIKQMIFSVGVNKNGNTYYIHGSSSYTGGEVSGSGIIEVKDGELPATIWLENKSLLINQEIKNSGDVYLSNALVNGSFSMIQFNSEDTGESQAPLVMLKQVLNENVIVPFEERIPFTKAETEIIPNDKGITVDNSGEITVTKGTYLAMWNVNILPVFINDRHYRGNITYQVSLFSIGLEKKKLAITGIKTAAYADAVYWPQISSQLSGSTVFRIEDSGAKIVLENSSWMNIYDTWAGTETDEGIKLEVTNTFEKILDRTQLVDVSSSSLTIIKIS